MAEIIRTPDRAEGGLTNDERSRMAEHAELWIRRAMRTAPIEPDKIVPAVKGLYAAAGLETPRIVIVPSPIVMAMASMFASAIWHWRTLATRDATVQTTHDATRSVVRDATLAAADDATIRATFAATRSAVRHATDAAVRDATNHAVDSAVRDAASDATFRVVQDATVHATEDAVRSATNHAVDSATLDAARDATFRATDAAVRNAVRDTTFHAMFAVARESVRNAVRDTIDRTTLDAMDDATVHTTRDATFHVVRDATDDATADAVRSATHRAVVAAMRDAVRDTDDAVGELMALMLECLPRWWRIYQGGNMWAGWECYLTAARDILGLRLPAHSKYAYWEQAAIHGGYRAMHQQFCMVCDFPERIKVDESRRPHCDGGPSHRWRDGWSIWHLHGVRVPQWLAETPAGQIDPRRIADIDNAEVRREFVHKVGYERLCYSLDAEQLDRSDDGMYELLRLDLGEDRKWLYLKMRNPSLSTADNEVWHVEGVANECRSVQDALLYRINGNGARNYKFDPCGADWRIHGDVIIAPQGATTLKPAPVAIS